MRSSSSQTCPVNLWADAWPTDAGAGARMTEDLGPAPMPSFIRERTGANQWL